MASKHGIRFFSLDTSILTDDEKVFELMATAGDVDDEAAYAAFGRWVALLCRIYREGPAMQLDARAERKLARDLGMTKDQLVEFVGHCVDAGLLDRGLWESERVMTSRGVQKRWLSAMTAMSKRRKTLPPEMQGWSLLDSDGTADDAAIAAQLPQNPARCGDCGAVAAEPRTVREVFQDAVEEEIREDETREDEEELFSSSVSGIVGAPPCMAAARDDGTWFPDDADGVYPTIGEALQARYAHRTGLSDFPDFIAKVAKHCPNGCRGDPQRAGQCHALIARALDRYDPSYGSGPLPLTLRIIDMDRGF